MKKVISKKTQEVELIQQDDRFLVSSKLVAKHFGKRHNDVLKAIKNGLGEVSEDFGLRNFAPSSYLNRQNKEQPAYNLTRDGFSYVCMGFTGKKAAEWKVKYIEAFHAMEMALRTREHEEIAALKKEKQVLIAIELKREKVLQGIESLLGNFEKGKKVNTAERLEKILDGYIAYWAHLENINFTTAKNITLRVNDVDNCQEIDVKYGKVVTFLEAMIYKPVVHGDGTMTEQQHQIITKILEACSHFSWAPENSLGTFLQKYKIELGKLNELSETGANKFIHLLFAHFIETWTWTKEQHLYMQLASDIKDLLQ